MSKKTYNLRKRKKMVNYKDEKYGDAVKPAKKLRIYYEDILIDLYGYGIYINTLGYNVVILDSFG